MSHFECAYVDVGSCHVHSVLLILVCVDVGAVMVPIVDAYVVDGEVYTIATSHHAHGAHQFDIEVNSRMLSLLSCVRTYER